MLQILQGVIYLLARGVKRVGVRRNVLQYISTTCINFQPRAKCCKVMKPPRKVAVAQCKRGVKQDVAAAAVARRCRMKAVPNARVEHCKQVTVHDAAHEAPKAVVGAAGQCQQRFTERARQVLRVDANVQCVSNRDAESGGH